MKGSAVRSALGGLVLVAALAGSTTGARAQAFVGQAQVLPIVHLYTMCAQGSARACDLTHWSARQACFAGALEDCRTHRYLWSAFSGQNPRAFELGGFGR